MHQHQILRPAATSLPPLDFLDGPLAALISQDASDLQDSNQCSPSWLNLSSRTAAHHDRECHSPRRLKATIRASFPRFREEQSYNLLLPPSELGSVAPCTSRCIDQF